METITKNKLYEGMFLIDSTLAGSDWDGVNNTITTILEKAKAEIVSMRKWDDRRLAYEIKGKGRGTYILCYFRADGEKIKDIEKAVQLSEQIIRVLILSAERMTTEDIEKDTPASEVEKDKEEAIEKAAQEAEAEQQSAGQQEETEEESKKEEETEQANVIEQGQEEFAADEQESELRE